MNGFQNHHLMSKYYNEFDSDKCLSFYPFLWTEEGSVESSSIRVVPVEEAFGIKDELLNQLGDDKS